MHLLPTQDEVVQVSATPERCATAISEYPAACTPTITAGSPGHALLPAIPARSGRPEPAAARQPRDPGDHSPSFRVTPATGGLPSPTGVCEALRANQVYLAERGAGLRPLRFASSWNRHPVKTSCWGRHPPLGSKLSECARCSIPRATVVAIAVVIYHPTPNQDFGAFLSIICQARRQLLYDSTACDLCKRVYLLESLVCNSFGPL